MPFHEFSIPVKGESLVLIAHKSVVERVDTLINRLTEKVGYAPDRIVVSPLTLLELQWYFFHDVNLYAGIQTPFVPTVRTDYRGVDVHAISDGELLSDIRRILEEAQTERQAGIKKTKEVVNADLFI